MDSLLFSPLEDINCSFEDYVRNKKKQLSLHMSGNGLPDYAYCMDYEYRKKLDAIPGLYKNLRRMLMPEIQKKYQQYNMAGVKASPTQFSDVYQMGYDCAKILGIGIPTILVVDSFENGGTFNACSFCVDDQEPLILVTGLMVERMTPGELKCIIGHECGHTHNSHAIYQYAAGIIADVGIMGLIKIPGIAQVAGLMSAGTECLLKMWDRAAEVTADRAAMLCCDSLEDAFNVNKKLMYGGAKVNETINVDFDINELKKQYNTANDSIYRIAELNYNHPIAIRRILAEMEFKECDTLYSWRPDLKQPGLQLKTKAETDEACKKIVGVMKKKDGRK